MDQWLLRLVNEWHGHGIYLYVLITTLFAGLISSVIGLERQLQGEAAGIRTHALIAVASSLLMTISIWAIRMADGTLDIEMGTVSDNLNYDTSRIAAAAVTGIGFLGGGVIIKERFSIRGLATSATLWICTAIGLACGAWLISGAGITAAVVLVVLLTFDRILRLIDRNCPAVVISADSDYPLPEKLREFSAANGFPLRHIRIIRCDVHELRIRASYQLSADPTELAYISQHFLRQPEVHSATEEGTWFSKRVGREGTD